MLLAIGYATAVATNPNFEHWSIKLLLGLLISAGIGAIVTGIIWAIESYKRKNKKTENKPSPIEQSKSLQVQNQLSIGELLGYVHAHKCSKCGWGIKVGLFNRVAPCPNCGNVDNLYKGNDDKTKNQ